MIRSWFWLIGLWILLAPDLAHAQNRYTNSNDGAISEIVTPCTAPLVRNFVVPESFTVNDVNIGVLLAHTYRGDLLMTLQSPAGTRVQFFAGTGATADNFNVLLDDAATGPVSGHAANDTATATTLVPPYQRNFQPAAALNAFNGQAANGTWRLEICDRLDVDAGTFYQADLFLTAAPAAISATKISSILGDGVNISNFKAIPGALVRYCITVSNAGPGIATSINATDPLPIQLSYTPGSLRTGTSCATATALEDDDASGPDESDPVGAAISGTTVQFSTPSIASGGSFAITFDATIQ
jgi:uncharacterized repeat protein (TIGR01451 family)